MSSPKTPDTITQAATQATAANEYRMRGDATISGIGGSEAARSYGLATLTNAATTALAVGVVTNDPLTTGAAALATAVASAFNKGKIGWSI